MCLYLRSVAWDAGGREALLEVVYTATKAGSEVAYSELWPLAALGHRVQNVV